MKPTWKTHRTWVPKKDRPEYLPRSPVALELLKLGHRRARGVKHYSRKGRRQEEQHG
jgi:hypothetical protein